MKPIYNSNKGRTARPRKACRQVGVMTKQLLTDAKKYQISKLEIGMTLIGLGVNVLMLGKHGI